MEKISICPLCGDNLLSLWSKLQFSKCSHCGLVIRNPFPTEDELSKLYKSAWKTPETRTSETGDVDLPLASLYGRALLNSLERSHFRGSRILDFGAGKGALTKSLLELGADVYAVEPYGYGRLRDDGYQVFEDLDGIPEGLCFDGVVTLDVVEHLRRPWDVISILFDKIQPGGWICVATPNPDGLNARLTRDNWREARKPGHILFLNENVLAQVLRNAGFENIRPLRWRIGYSNNPLRRWAQTLLQMTSFSGITRLLGYKPAN